MDNEQSSGVGKLPKHVEQASWSRSLSKARPQSRIGDGGAAKDLLTHGAGWDMMHWVNDVLGKSEGVHPGGNRVITRIENLDIGRMRRLVDHVLFKLRATREWVCRCGHTNPSQAPRCESCYMTRGKGERRAGRNSPFRRESGGSGEDAEEPNHLGPRVSKLWAKLIELRDVPVQDSLAAFPEDVDSSSMAAILNENSPLRVGLVRFLMECDEALSMRRDGYLNPLYDHSRANGLPTALSPALSGSLYMGSAGSISGSGAGSSQTSPRTASPLGDSSVSTSSSLAGSDRVGPQLKPGRVIIATSRASFSSVQDISEVIAARPTPLTDVGQPPHQEDDATETPGTPAVTSNEDDINPAEANPSPFAREPADLLSPSPMPALSGQVSPHQRPRQSLLETQGEGGGLPAKGEVTSTRRSNGLRSQTVGRAGALDGSESSTSRESWWTPESSPSRECRGRSLSAADAAIICARRQEALSTGSKWGGKPQEEQGGEDAAPVVGNGCADPEQVESFRGVRQEWERRANESADTRGLAHSSAKEVDPNSRMRRPSARIGSGLGVGNLKAIFEKRQEAAQPPRLDGRRHVYDSDGSNIEMKGAPNTMVTRPSHFRGGSTKTPAEDTAWITSENEGAEPRSSSDRRDSTERTAMTPVGESRSATASYAATAAAPKEVHHGSPVRLDQGLVISTSDENQPMRPEVAGEPAKTERAEEDSDFNSDTATEPRSGEESLRAPSLAPIGSTESKQRTRRVRQKMSYLGVKGKCHHDAVAPPHARRGKHVLQEIRRRESRSKKGVAKEVDKVALEDKESVSGQVGDLPAKDSKETQTMQPPDVSDTRKSRDGDRASVVHPEVSVGIVRKTLEALREGGRLSKLPPPNISVGAQLRLDGRQSMEDRKTVFGGPSDDSVPAVSSGLAGEEKVVSPRKSPIASPNRRGKSLSKDEVLGLAVHEAVGVDSGNQGVVSESGGADHVGAVSDDLDIVGKKADCFLSNGTDETINDTKEAELEETTEPMPAGSVEETTVMDQGIVSPLRDPSAKADSAEMSSPAELPMLLTTVAIPKEPTSATTNATVASQQGRSAVDELVVAASPLDVSPDPLPSTKSPVSTKSTTSTSTTSPPALMEKLGNSKTCTCSSPKPTIERSVTLPPAPTATAAGRIVASVHTTEERAVTGVIGGQEDRFPRALVPGHENSSQKTEGNVNRARQVSHEGTFIPSKFVTGLSPMEIREQGRDTPDDGEQHALGRPVSADAVTGDLSKSRDEQISSATEIAASANGNSGAEFPRVEKVSDARTVSPPGGTRVAAEDSTPPTTACTIPQKVRGSRMIRENVSKNTRVSPPKAPATEGSRPGGLHDDDADTTNADCGGRKSLPPIAKRAGLRAAREGWGIMPAISPYSGRSSFSPPRSLTSLKVSTFGSPSAWLESPRRRASMSPGPRSTLLASRRRETLGPSWQATAAALSPLRWARKLTPRNTHVVEGEDDQSTPPSICDSPSKSIPWLSASASTPEAPIGDGDDLYGDTFSPLSDYVEEKDDSVVCGECGCDGKDEEEAEEERAGGGEYLARELPEFVANAAGLVGSLRTLVACQMVNRSWHLALGSKRGRNLFGSIVRASGIPDRLRPAVWQALVIQAVAAKRGEGSGGGILGTGSTNGTSTTRDDTPSRGFTRLVEDGQKGPHAALIARDVPRAFGAVAPHKRHERGDGSISGASVAEAVAAAAIREVKETPGGSNHPERENQEVYPRRGRGVPGLGLLTNLLGLMGSDDIVEDTFAPRRHSLGRSKSHRSSVSVADLGNDILGMLPQSVSPRASFSSASPPPRARASSRPFSLSPPRAHRSVTPPSGRVFSIGKNRRQTVGGSSRSSWAPESPRARTSRHSFGVEDLEAKTRRDALWMAEADSQWEEVPVEAKRQCLSNVLLAVSARFPGVGYCQGMDRLLAMLMRFYFISSEDTLVGKAVVPEETAPSPLPPPPVASSVKPRRLGFEGRDDPSSSNLEALQIEKTTSSENGDYIRNDGSCSREGKASGDATPLMVDQRIGAILAPSKLVDERGVGTCEGYVNREGGDGDGTVTVQVLPCRTSPLVQKGSPPSVSSSSSESASPAIERVMLGERVFTVFSGLFEGFRLHDLYLPERGGVLVCTEVLQVLSRRRLPDLACHFDEIDFSIDMVAMGWFQTLFVYLHAMPRATVRRIWDWWLSSGDFEVFFRISMALLMLSKGILMELDFDSTVQYFNNFPQPRVLAPDVLLPSAAAVEIDEGELMYLELQVRQREKLDVESVTQLMLRPVL